MKNTSAGVRRILVVEDEPAIAEVCLRVLSSEGFTVDIAQNGSVAEAKLQERSDYNLILIDIRTPVMNGRELYQWINEKHPELVKRVIFSTGEVMGSDMQNFIERTGKPFLPKPFTTDELRTIVRETLRQIRE